MSYTRNTWVNDTSPYLNATDLNNFEVGILSQGGTALSVTAYGAVGDGTTDDSAAFLAAHTAARAAIVANSGGTGESDSRGRVKIVIPPGRYKLVTAESLMSANSGTVTEGIVYEGAGRGISEILWQPASAAKLMRNNDVWRGVHMKGLSFVSKTAGAMFFHSSSTGAAQDYRFTDCSWAGTWNYCVGLDGTNTNSEFLFDRPWIYGEGTTTFLYIGMTAATIAQDQFVNYTFLAPTIFMDGGGTFIRADYGGAIRVYGANAILDNGGLLYDLRTNTHNRAAESLTMRDSRVELRDATDQVISCLWGRGSVTFDTVDEESQVDTVSQTAVTASYLPANNDGPAVRYVNCKLSGEHEYGYKSNTYAGERKVLYEQCETEDEPHVFINNVDEGSGNSGGVVAAEFRNHRTRLYDSTRIYDQVYQWQSTVAAQPQRRSASFRSPFAGLPSNTPSIGSVDLWLPMGAVVTGVRFYKPSGGAATNTDWIYAVKTSEGGPTTLGSASGGGSVQWTTGFNEVDTPTGGSFVCNSDAKRHLVLSATNVTGDAGSTSFVLVEYTA